MKLKQNHVDLQDRMEGVSEHQCFNHQGCTVTDINSKGQFPKQGNVQEFVPYCLGRNHLLYKELNNFFPYNNDQYQSVGYSDPVSYIYTHIYIFYVYMIYIYSYIYIHIYPTPMTYTVCWGLVAW